MSIFNYVTSPIPGAHTITRNSSVGPITLYREESHAGCVVNVYERNGYDDSDFVAVVYIPKEDTFKHITYVSTRYASENDYASIDASPEIVEKYNKFTSDLAKYAAKLANLRNFKKGDVVKVIEGKHAGTKGELFWKGVDKYASSWVVRHGCDDNKYVWGVRQSNGAAVFVKQRYLADREAA